MESILEVLTPDNLVFIFKGFGLTLYISLIALIYFSFNLAISSLSHMLAKRWQQAAE